MLMAQNDSNDDEELNKLIAEIDEAAPSEESSVLKSDAIKDKQAENTLKEIKHTKPDWADKKDDDYNIYDYSEKEVEDKEW